MPVAEGTPAPLADALATMEGAVQDFKSSLPYLPPEQMDERFGLLQMEIAEGIVGLYQELTEDAS